MLGFESVSGSTLGMDVNGFEESEGSTSVAMWYFGWSQCPKHKATQEGETSQFWCHQWVKNREISTSSGEPLIGSMLSSGCSSPGSVKKRRPSLTSVLMSKQGMCPRIYGGACATSSKEFRELESMTKYFQQNDLSTLRIRSVTEHLQD